jgi:hypothetical protein
MRKVSVASRKVKRGIGKRSCRMMVCFECDENLFDDEPDCLK